MIYRRITKRIVTIALIVGSMLFMDLTVLAQTPSDERGEFQARRKMIMDGNNLRANYHNFTWGGRLDGDARDEVEFEFPRNTNRVYIALVAFFVGAEVANQSENPEADEFFPIVITPNGRTSPQGDSWDINPVPGYYNPAAPGFARSDNPSTWPAFWPDKVEDGGWAGEWNGFFGRDVINADQEFFYRASDNTYMRFSGESPSSADRIFRPDQTDLSRGGLGLIIDARIMAWSQTLISDTHFNIFEIRNDGSYNYQKMAFTLWIADLVGGGGSDRPEFDEQQAIAYLTHLNRTNSPPEFDGGFVGMAGIQFLETPGNSIDGIDNDGDANRYIPGEVLYNPSNPNLLDPLIVAGGGFFPDEAFITENIIPEFTVDDFAERTLTAGDRIVLIDENYNRIIAEYEPGATIVTQGREITLPNQLIVREDTTIGTPLGGGPPQRLHTTLFDEDLDGLIDENQPNHLTKSLFNPSTNSFIEQPVRYINYLWEGFFEVDGVTYEYAVGDTIQRGMVVPNRWIRERMENDSNFRTLIENYRDRLIAVHGSRWDEGFFDNYFRNHHTSAPMIDEARDDFFDNNMAWDINADDVGLDGVPFSGAIGEGDGFPTSGHGTPFPGEPNIDKTSVAESDMIGISAVSYPAAGSLGDGPGFAQDGPFWRNRMTPGNFGEFGGTQDTDLLVTSSYFPLQRGQTERFSVAITVAQTNGPSIEDDRERVNDNLREAFRAYESDYQFATAPPAPNLRVVPGDGQVTLYWDDVAESHFDRFISRLPGGTDNDAANFQGYKVYRSTDSGFQDIFTITDSRGNRIFRQPLVIFDRINEWSGLHPIDVNGIKFNLGNNSGLQRQYVDTDVRNGRTYYYAVTSYTHGFVGGVDALGNQIGIAPSESPIFISVNPDGSVSTGPNVAVVRPGASQAGYIDPENPMAAQVSGSGTGNVMVNIVDSDSIRVDDLYRITFQDTLIVSGSATAPDTLRTKNFTLRNVSQGRTLINESTAFFGEDNPVLQGFRIQVNNETRPLAINLDRSEWLTSRSDTIHRPRMILERGPQASPQPSDYKIVFGDVGFGLAREFQVGNQTFPARPVNFRVYNLTDRDDDGNPREIDFAYDMQHNPDNVAEGAFSAGLIQNPVTQLLFERTDQIFFIENVRGQTDRLTWRVTLSPVITGTGQDRVVRSENPASGDTLSIVTNKQFSEFDVFEFRMDESNVGSIDEDLIKEEFKNIRVVPNPYVVSNPFESRGTSAQPDQRRELHFTRLPVPDGDKVQRVTLRIFTVSGQLVQTIDITDGNTFNGTYIWNLLSKDNLEISYGIYIFHVDVPGVGEHIDKFAVIK